MKAITHGDLSWWHRSVWSQLGLERNCDSSQHFFFFLPVTPRREKCYLCKAQHKWGGSRNWETLSCQLWMQPNCCATILTGLRWRESRGCWPALQHSWNSKQQEPGAETLHPGFSHSPRLSLSLSPSFFFPILFRALLVFSYHLSYLLCLSLIWNLAIFLLSVIII